MGELGEQVEVYRNDEISLDEISELNPDRIVVSPGPCTPNEAGISMDVIRKFSGLVPILGVCLGHQSIGQVFGGKIVKAANVMHGKTSPMHHNGTGVFKGLSNPFTATRYHSLVVARESLPDCLEVTAWTEQEGQIHEIMGFKHKRLNVEGVQFHPESIVSEHGHALFRNFVGTTDQGELT